MNQTRPMRDGTPVADRYGKPDGERPRGRFRIADVPRMFWVRMAAYGLLCAVLGAAAGWRLWGRDDSAGAAPSQTTDSGDITPPGTTGGPSVAALIHFDEDFCDSDFASFRERQEQLLKSRLVLTEALAESGLAAEAIGGKEPDTAAWVAEHLRIDFPGAGVMRVWLEHDNAHVAAQLANAVSGAFLKHYTQQRREQLAAQIADLDRRRQEQQRIVRQKERELADLARRYGAGGLDPLASLQGRALRRVSELEKELAEIRKQQASARQQLYQQQRIVGQDPEDVEVNDAELDLFAAGDAVAGQWQRQISEIEQQLAFAQVSVNPSAAGRWVERYQNALRVTRRRLASRREELRPLARQNKRLQAEAAVVELRTQIETLADKEDRLGEQLAGLKADAEKVAASSANVETIRNEIRDLEADLAQLQAQRDALKSEHDAGQWATMLQRAIVPYPVR